MSENTTTPVPVPPGAVLVYEWQRERCRVFEGEQRLIEETDIKVWTHGIQHQGGRIDDGAIEPPLISVAGLVWENGINSETARQLADLLVTAADEIETWSRGTNPEES